MFSKKIQKSLLISAVLIMSVATLAFARGGRGYGDCPFDNDGTRMERGMKGCGPGYNDANLTDEQKAKIEVTREKFWTETESLRTEMREKSLALRDEMDQETPDTAKLAEIQKNLSAVRAQFDQIAITHRLEMRQLLPEDARGKGFGRKSGGHCRW